MPLWIVIHPNQLSFWEHAGPVCDELDSFRASGWMSSARVGTDGGAGSVAASRLPTIPFYAYPHGAVAKKEGKAPRIVLDMGAPRTALYAIGESREPVPSLNERAGPMRPPKWPKEVKPTAGEAAEAGAILMAVAEPAGLPVFEVGLDFKKFFHQFPYTYAQACCAGAFVPAPSTDGSVSPRLRPEIVTVMAMGGSPASGIAQRASNAINLLVARRMDEAERDLLNCEPPAVKAWMRDRRRLPHGAYGTQARLFDIRTYTDDPKAQVVGVRRTVRLLCELYDLCVRTFRLDLAGPEKWALGSSGVWVGVAQCAMLGVAWLPRAKVLRALAQLGAALRGELRASAWREMMGFLEHVGSVLHLHRYSIQRLWRPLEPRAVSENPAVRIAPDREEAELLSRHARRIADAPGASLLACVRPDPTHASAVVYDLVGDAALEPDDPDAGLGGHLYNIWSYLPLTQRMRDSMAISHLEFAQVCMLFITHHRDLAHASHVCLVADALATPMALAKHSKRSPRMRALHTALMEHTAYRVFLQPAGRLLTRHRFGAANPVGDAASRKQIPRMRQLMRQFGQTPVERPYSAEAVAWLERALDAPAFVEARRARARAADEVAGPPSPARGCLRERGGYCPPRQLPGAPVAPEAPAPHAIEASRLTAGALAEVTHARRAQPAPAVLSASEGTGEPSRLPARGMGPYRTPPTRATITWCGDYARLTIAPRKLDQPGLAEVAGDAAPRQLLRIRGGALLEDSFVEDEFEVLPFTPPAGDFDADPPPRLPAAVYIRLSAESERRPIGFPEAAGAVPCEAYAGTAAFVGPEASIGRLLPVAAVHLHVRTYLFQSYTLLVEPVPPAAQLGAPLAARAPNYRRHEYRIAREAAERIQAGAAGSQILILIDLESPIWQSRHDAELNRIESLPQAISAPIRFEFAPPPATPRLPRLREAECHPFRVCACPYVGHGGSGCPYEAKRASEFCSECGPCGASAHGSGHVCCCRDGCGGVTCGSAKCGPPPSESWWAGMVLPAPLPPPDMGDVWPPLRCLHPARRDAGPGGATTFGELAHAAFEHPPSMVYVRRPSAFDLVHLWPNQEPRSRRPTTFDEVFVGLAHFFLNSPWPEPLGPRLEVHVSLRFYVNGCSILLAPQAAPWHTDGTDLPVRFRKSEYQIPSQAALNLKSAPPDATIGILINMQAPLWQPMHDAEMRRLEPPAMLVDAPVHFEVARPSSTALTPSTGAARPTTHVSCACGFVGPDGDPCPFDARSGDGLFCDICAPCPVHVCSCRGDPCGGFDCWCHAETPPGTPESPCYSCGVWRRRLPLTSWVQWWPTALREHPPAHAPARCLRERGGGREIRRPAPASPGDAATPAWPVAGSSPSVGPPSGAAGRVLAGGVRRRPPTSPPADSPKARAARKLELETSPDSVAAATLSPRGSTEGRRRPPPHSPTQEHEPAPASASRPLPHAAALAERTLRLTKAAASDTSHHALRPRSPERLTLAIERLARAAQLSAPLSTLKQEESNMRHWEAVCATWNTAIVRPSAAMLNNRSADAYDLECAFWADALFIIMRRQREDWERNPRGRALPPRPAAALQVLRGVRRVHVKRLFIETVPITAAVAVTEGLLRDYATVHGPEALLPARKEPFTGAMIARLLQLPEGTKVGARSVRRDALEWMMIFALIAFLAQSGCRKAEVSLGAGIRFGLMHLSLWHLRWRISAALPDGADGKPSFIAAPSAAQLALIQIGDYAIVVPPPSKADQLGLHWAADPIYLPWHPSDEINAARELGRLEGKRAVPPEERRNVPLFTDGSGQPLRHSSLDAALEGMLATFLDAPTRKKYSWHSFRVFLACALQASGVSGPQIQCLCRWRTAEALKLYARMNPADYAGLLRGAMGADVSSVRSTYTQSLLAHPIDADLAVAEGIEESAELRRLARLPDED